MIADITLRGSVAAIKRTSKSKWKGERERERATELLLLQYKLETISRVYTNCFRPEYRPSPPPFTRLPTSEHNFDRPLCNK